MRIIVFAVLSLITATIISCRDDDMALPPITQRGANTFGCRIDNKIYVPENGGAGSRAEVLNDRIVVLGGADNVTITLQIIDSIKPIVVNQPYEFEKGVKRKCEYLSWTKSSSCLYGDDPISGSITFSKIDRINGIVSGTFEFTAFSKECNKSAAITDGRFDIRLDH